MKKITKLNKNNWKRIKGIIFIFSTTLTTFLFLLLAIFILSTSDPSITTSDKLQTYCSFLCLLSSIVILLDVVHTLLSKIQKKSLKY